MGILKIAALAAVVAGLVGYLVWAGRAMDSAFDIDYGDEDGQ